MFTLPRDSGGESADRGMVFQPSRRRRRADAAPKAKPSVHCAARCRIAGRPSRFRRTNNVVVRDTNGVARDAAEGSKEERKMGLVRGKRRESIGLGKNLQGARYSNTARAKPIHAGVHSSPTLKDHSGAFETRARSIENPPKYFESTM